MPKVRFKRNFKYALDGVDVVTYPANTTRDVPGAVARSAVRQGAAEMVQEGGGAKGAGAKGTTTNRSTGAQTKANQGASGGGAKVEEQGGS